MKKMKFKYKILIAILITALCLVLPFSYKVKAETNEEKIQQYDASCDIEMLINKYKLSIEKIPNTSNQYKIFVNGDRNAVGNAEFKVEKIITGSLHGSIESLGTIKHGQDLYLNIDSATGADGHKGVAVEVTMIQTLDGCLSSTDEAYEGNPSGKGYVGTFFVTLEITDTQPIINNNGKPNKVNNPHVGSGKMCTNFINGTYNASQFPTSQIKKADFDAYNYAVVTNEGKNYYKELLPYCFNNQVEAAYTDEELLQMIKSVISIWKTYSTPVGGGSQSFNDSFNSIKAAADAAGTSKGSPSSPAPNSTNLTYTNKCDYNQIGRASKNYYTAQIVANENATYSYNYAPGLERSETKKICDVLCEEAVKVEYGAPIASKAGLCFDYTVKVESYVKCTPKYTRNEPRVSHSYCTPNVLCVSQKGTVRTKPQAGPNDEFDSCIKACDGGKYTQKCSLKCYNEVYKNKKNLPLAYENIKQNSVQKLSGGSLSTCLSVNYDGCYVVSGGRIEWQANDYGRYNTDALGRFYRESGYNMGLIGGGYFVDYEGFSRAEYANGAQCSDNCEWQYSCPSNMYLNPNMSVYDYQDNLQAYQRAVSKCEAATSCSRKTATFTIAVKYDTKDGDAHTTVNKVYYPYTSNAQHKKNPTENSSEYNTVSKDTFTSGNGYKSDTSTIIDYDGCYKSADNIRWYLTEWGFPGTYINNKTGEISFSTPSDLSGWYLEKKKFCIPLNAESINKKWWEWKVIGNHCISESAILNELNGQAGTSNGYNIEAIAKNFGYFGWNFTTKCFYAIRNEVCDTDKSASRCCPVGGAAGGGGGATEEETTGYVVRTVDPKNIFPNSGYNVVDDKRRDIGFNWTQDATILSMKNPQYQVNPQDLKETIESNADILYAEEPDYQFYLTPQDLTKLRQYNDKYSYATWNGTTSSVNGVNSYKSNLFRAVGIESNIISSTAKKIGTPGVNNE